MKVAFVILTYASPSVLNDHLGRPVQNFIDYRTPITMPHGYLYDACPIGRSSLGLYYESLGHILEDGWEPISVGEYVGGTHCYGRLYTFKKRVEYHPGHYSG